MRTFSFMVMAGLEYGCIWTGEAIIFLQVPEDPRTVFYHLSIPKENVRESTDWSEESGTSNRLHLTAVGMMLAFTLQATMTPPRSNSWRLKAMRQLRTWNLDYMDLLKSMPEMSGTMPENLSSKKNSRSHKSPIQFSQSTIHTCFTVLNLGVLYLIG
ncbi:hypothetical protein K3495_g953 [Podosphaera aphanis]|nr:hypothetical protein K3495_g953 [Podosphaera aphanis]